MVKRQKLFYGRYANKCILDFVLSLHLTNVFFNLSLNKYISGCYLFIYLFIKASEKIWEKIGDVISGNARKIYDGDQYFEQGEYDYIFDVDYDGLPKKLPFNEGDNVLEAADKFLAREGLGRAYVEQISNFIKNNTRGMTQQKKPQAKQKKEEV